MVSSDNSISTAKLLEGVEKSYDKGKKLLDESKDLTEGETSFRVDNENSQRDSGSGNNSGSMASPVDNTVARLAEIATKTAGKLGVKVNAVKSPDEITDPQVRKDIEGGKAVQGWYDAKTGEVHLYNAEHTLLARRGKDRVA